MVNFLLVERIELLVIDLLGKALVGPRKRKEKALCKKNITFTRTHKPFFILYFFLISRSAPAGLGTRLQAASERDKNKQTRTVLHVKRHLFITAGV